MSVVAHLAELSLGFRSRFLTYDEVGQQLRAWAAAFPEVARVVSIGTSGAGRELMLLVIGREPERVRPAAWIDANMHATELSGSSVALALAEDLLGVVQDPGAELHALPPHVREQLARGLYYVLPRLSPDGAEEVLGTGRWLRSVPRDARDSNKPRWVARDLDGDGLSLVMRKLDPTGEWVALPGAPHVLVERELDDPGPAYKLYPEGEIERFDGWNVPEPHFMADNYPDLNRNFPYTWAPEHEQAGAGAFALSEPETRAVVEFVSAHPEIFAWLNLHTFGGVFIRPLGAAPDTKMDPHDLAIFKQIAEWGERFANYPTVSGFEEFTYEPERPLHGDLSDFGYHQRGAIAYVCELWDLPERLGVPRTKRFVDRYGATTRTHIERLVELDRSLNSSRVFGAWRPFTHPQLGEVELGAFDPRVGIWNPPFELLGELCQGQAAAFLRVAALAPDVRVAALEARAIGEGLFEIGATVHNLGYLGSYVLASAKKLSWNEPLSAELELSGGALVDPGSIRREVGHLDGWGLGRGGPDGGFAIPRSRGSVSERRVAWIVRGSGSARVTVRGPRVGAIHAQIAFG